MGFGHAPNLSLVLDELGEAHASAAHFVVEQLFAEVDALLALIGAHVAADAGAGAGRDAEVQPVFARLLVLRGHDFDHVAALQLVAERHDLAVGARARTVLADLRVNGVRKIDRRGAAGQHAQIALGGEDVDLVREEVDFHALQELDRILEVALEISQFAQPAEAFSILGIDAARDALFVLPVRGDAVFSNAVHLVGANLNFDALPARANHRGVQGLVHVGFGQRDVILETPGDRRPLGVHDAQGGIAIGYGFHTHAESHGVEHLFELTLLLLHLAMNREHVLGAPRRFTGKALFSQARGDGARHGLDVVGALFLRLVQLARQHAEVFRIQVAERQIFQLALDALHAEAASERRVDLHCLPSDALLRLGLHVIERAHVVEAVTQLDQQDADVLRHGHDHLAEALRLPVLARDEVDLAELGDPIHDGGDLFAEVGLDLLHGGGRIFQHVVQQPGAHAGRVELQLGGDAGNACRVHEVRLPALPGLLPVRPL